MIIDLQKIWSKWTPTQLKFCGNFQHIEQLLIGGWGSGKTTAGVRKAIILSYFNPASRGLIARQTYRELHDSTLQTFWEQCPPELIIRYVKKDETLYMHSYDPNTPSVILFRSMDNPQKFQSLELHYAYIDEASEVFVDENKYYLISRRLRQKGMKRHFMLLTSASPSRNSTLYKLFVEEQGNNPQRIVYKIPSYENKDNLPQDYINQLEMLPEEMKRQYLYGEWGLDIKGKPVFPEFNSQMHIQPLAPLQGYDIVRSWDFGFHRPACLFLQIGPNMRIYVLKEYIGADIYLTEFAQRIVAFSINTFPNHSFQDVCDPSGASIRDSGVSSLEILRDFHITPIYRKLHILQRINIIKKLLSTLLQDGKPAILIDPSCEVLINALAGGYHFPQYYSGKSGDEPVKDGYYDHIIDCLGYFVAVFQPTESSEFKRIRKPGIIRIK